MNLGLHAGVGSGLRDGVISGKVIGNVVNETGRNFVSGKTVVHECVLAWRKMNEWMTGLVREDWETDR